MIGYVDRRERSGWEIDFRRWLLSRPDIPTPKTNVTFDGWEPDVYWPDHHVALELDGGPWHSAIEDMARDRLKDTKLLILMARTIRVSEERWLTQRLALERDIRALLTQLAA